MTLTISIAALFIVLWKGIGDKPYHLALYILAPVLSYLDGVWLGLPWFGISRFWILAAVSAIFLAANALDKSQKGFKEYIGFLAFSCLYKPQLYIVAAVFMLSWSIYEKYKERGYLVKSNISYVILIAIALLHIGGRNPGEISPSWDVYALSMLLMAIAFIDFNFRSLLAAFGALMYLVSWSETPLALTILLCTNLTLFLFFYLCHTGSSLLENKFGKNLAFKKISYLIFRKNAPGQFTDVPRSNLLVTKPRAIKKTSPQPSPSENIFIQNAIYLLTLIALVFSALAASYNLGAHNV